MNANVYGTQSFRGGGTYTHTYIETPPISILLAGSCCALALALLLSHRSRV